MDPRPQAVDARVRGRRARAILAAACAVLVAAASSGQRPPDADGIARPDGARRLTRVFDFEEPNNPHPVPEGWERAIDNPRANVRRPGFPAHNEPTFDFSVAASGTTSVLIATKGGGSALRLMPGEVAVFVDADYAVTARVRTSGFRNARAFLTARFLDEKRRALPGSEVRSLPAPPDTDGAWADLTCELGRARPGAAWLQIDLELLQPDQFLPADPRLGVHEVRREDISGKAWFDDVTVLQVPRVRLGTNPPGNIVAAPQSVQIEAVVRDLGGDSLTAELSVRNLDGEVVDRLSAPADPSGKPLRWSPRLPAYGWYSAELAVAADGMIVSRSQTPIVWLSPRRAEPSVERKRFGLVINNAGPTPEPLIADAAARIGSGFVILPGWDSTLLSTEIAASTPPRRAGIEQLLRGGQEVTVCIPGAPSDIAATLAIDPAEMGEFARLAPTTWGTPLDYLLDLFGQRLLRYQIGPTGTDAWFWDKDPGPALRTYRDSLAKVVPGPLIGVPWRGETEPEGSLFDDHSPPRNRADFVTLTLPLGFEPRSSFAQMAGVWPGTLDGPELTAVLELPSIAEFGPDALVAELARRVLEFWAAFGNTTDDPQGRPARLAINQPWSRREHDDTTISPSPALPVLRELISRLDDRRVVGEYPSVTGVRCLIIAGHGRDGELTRGALAAWNIAAASDEAVIDATALGADLRVFDVFGNELADRIGVQDGRAVIRLTQTPVFIENAEPYLSLFAAGARIEPGFLRAIATEHEGAIVLKNPWPIRITGQVQVKDPDEPSARRTDWTFWPQGVVDFAAAPGEEIRIPLTVSFGASQIAGTKDLWLITRVQADREYPPLRLRSPVEIGLVDVDLQTEVVLSPGIEGPDVIVVASVTNRGVRNRDLRLETAAWGYPSQQQQVSGLAPGQTVTRRFPLKGGAISLKGRRVVVSLADDEEAERLNKAAIVP